MTCQETGLLIHALADGELDLTKSLEMEAHLQDCPRCALAQEEIRDLGYLMKDASLRFTPSASFEKRLRSAVRREAKEKPLTQGWWRWAMAARTSSSGSSSLPGRKVSGSGSTAQRSTTTSTIGISCRAAS